MNKNKLPYHKNKNFRIPEGYFETLENRIMDAVITTTKKESTLPKHQETGFKVPEGYFDSFEDRLFEKIETATKSTKVRNLFNNEVFYYIAGTAAVFVAILTTLFTVPAPNGGFEDVHVTTLESYLYESLEWSNSELSHYLSEEEAYAAPADHTEIDFEAVYEYLNENVEEPSILFNEN